MRGLSPMLAPRLSGDGDGTSGRLVEKGQGENQSSTLPSVWALLAVLHDESDLEASQWLR